MSEEPPSEDTRSAEPAEAEGEVPTLMRGRSIDLRRSLHLPLRREETVLRGTSTREEREAQTEPSTPRDALSQSQSLSRSQSIQHGAMHKFLTLLEQAQRESEADEAREGEGRGAALWRLVRQRVLHDRERAWRRQVSSSVPAAKPTRREPLTDVDWNAEAPPCEGLTHGTLANGVQYFLFHHPHPSKQVRLALHVRAGSVHENDAEQGFAHLCEHIAFMCRSQFGGDAILDYMASQGIQFGADANAHTTTDETVYFLQAPPVHAMLDSALKILRGWGGDMVVGSSHVRHEVGVVLAEMRDRCSKMNQLCNWITRAVLFGSKYALRLPIGTVETLEATTPASLSAFYKRNYTPSRLSVIAVGDLDGKEDDILALIDTHFSSLQAAEEGEDWQSGLTPEEIQEVNTGRKTLSASMLALAGTDTIIVALWSRIPDPPRNSLRYYELLFVICITTIALNLRLRAFGRGAGVRQVYSDSFYARYDALGSVVQIVADIRADAVKENVQELVHHLQALLMRDLDADDWRLILRQARTVCCNDVIQSSDAYVSAISVFLTAGVPLMDSPQLAPYVDALVAKYAEPSTFRAGLMEILGEPSVLYLYPPDLSPLPQFLPIEGYFSEPADAVLDRICAEVLLPATAELVLAPEEIPPPFDATMIVRTETPVGDGKMRVLKLSNDTVVQLTVTPSLISSSAGLLFEAISRNDSGTYALARAYREHGAKGTSPRVHAARLATTLAQSPGLGLGGVDLTVSGIGAGVWASTVKPTTLHNELGLQAISSNIKEAEALLQIVYAIFTRRADWDPRIVTREHAHIVDELRAEERNMAPETRLQREVTTFNHGNHPLFSAVTADDIAAVDLTLALDYLSKIFSRARDYTFALVGTFSEEDADEVERMLVRYIGALPAAPDLSHTMTAMWAYLNKELAFRPYDEDGQNIRIFYHGHEEQAHIQMTFPIPTYDELTDSLVTAVLGLVQRRLYHDFVQVRGAAYSVTVSQETPYHSEAVYRFTCAPEHARALLAAFEDVLMELVNSGFTDEEVASAITAAERNLESNAEQASIWTYDSKDVESFNNNLRNLRTVLTPEIARLAFLALSGRMGGNGAVVGQHTCVLVLPEATRGFLSIAALPWYKKKRTKRYAIGALGALVLGAVAWAAWRFVSSRRGAPLSNSPTDRLS